LSLRRTDKAKFAEHQGYVHMHPHVVLSKRVYYGTKYLPTMATLRFENLFFQKFPGARATTSYQ
jgi:hypothetical protein